jgi:ubiquinone/menaquinone biosynthesis C-methylase UbiE
MSSFDMLADRFELYRPLPRPALVAIRNALLGEGRIDPGARLLEVGCGTGRIGAEFNHASDNYFGIDLSMEMLREFSRKELARRPNLVHGDGNLLPFRNQVFTAVLLMHVLGAGNWRALLVESQRVLQKHGLLAIGKTETPADGIDARMRDRLAELVAGMGMAEPSRDRSKMNEWLRAASSRCLTIEAARWNVNRTPRDFFLRKRSAPRFESLPENVKETALQALEDWTEHTIGPLDAPLSETHSFCLELHWF